MEHGNMSMKLQITAEDFFLRVCVSGIFSLANANKACVEMFKAVEQHKAMEVLVDCRHLAGSPSTMERFEHSEFGAARMIDFSAWITRFAYVGMPPLIDPQKFGETVAVNRGVKIKVFTNIEDALRWLELERAKRLNAGEGK